MVGMPGFFHGSSPHSLACCKCKFLVGRVVKGNAKFKEKTFPRLNQTGESASLNYKRAHGPLIQWGWGGVGVPNEVNGVIGNPNEGGGIPMMA